MCTYTLTACTLICTTILNDLCNSLVCTSSCTVSASGALQYLFLTTVCVFVAGTAGVTVTELQSSSVDGGQRSVPTDVEPLATRRKFTEEVATDSNVYNQTQMVSISLDEYRLCPTHGCTCTIIVQPYLLLHMLSTQFPLGRSWWVPRTRTRTQSVY